MGCPQHPKAGLKRPPHIQLVGLSSPGGAESRVCIGKGFRGKGEREMGFGEGGKNGALSSMQPKK